MENIFVQIAKLLALPTIRKNIAKAEKMMEEDSELANTINNLRYNVKIIDAKLPGFCERNPNSAFCKDKSKKDK